MKTLHDLYNLGGLMSLFTVLAIHLVAFLVIILLGVVLNPVFGFIERVYERILIFFEE